MPAPLRVETLTDADFNARAPVPYDEVPTIREIRIRQTTWMVVGALVSAFWLTIDVAYIPFGFVLSVVMGLLVRETAKAAHESFALPMYLLLSLLGSVAGLLILLYVNV